MDDDSLELAQRSSGEHTSEEEEAQAQLIVFYPNRQPVPYKLHTGVNVLGRQSSFAQRDAMRLHQWSSEYVDVNVHGIFLESSSISSAHAVVYLEAWGECCFIKDLASRNKTFVKRGGKHVAIAPQQKLPLQSGDTLTFGALKCRVSFGGSSEGGMTPPPGSSPVSRSSSGIPALRASSRAVSIGQRTASPGNPSGRSPSLDKCPSLQEWFQHPAYSTALDGPSGQTQPTPFEGVPKTRTWDENGANLAADMPSKPSFGFGTAIQEGSEHTNSDPEPETPRIDRPAVFYSPKLKPKRSPFASNPSGLDPMLEDEQEDEIGDPMSDVDLSTEAPMPAAVTTNQVAKDGSLSLEMGAETLAQLRTVPPLKGLNAGQTAGPSPSGAPPSATALHSQESHRDQSLPGTPGTVELNTPASPSNFAGQDSGLELWVAAPPGSLTDEEGSLDQTRGRPLRARQKTPTPKRSRSGRVTSPDKSQPRSKSPRLQRGFYIPSDVKAAAAAERHLKLDEIRDAVHDIWSDM